MQAFIEQATAKYADRFDYSRAVWSGPRGKLMIGCILHDVGFEQNAAAFLKQPGCKQCICAQKTAEFIAKAVKIHGNKYDYTRVEYAGCDTKVIILCRTHGSFDQTPYCHERGNGCSKCGIISTSNKRRGNTDVFVQKAREIHGDNYDYSLVNYETAIVKVTIICHIHGPFEQIPAGHLSGKGCPTCAITVRADNCRRTIDDFILKAREKHGESYNYSQVNYVNSNTKIFIICQQHGIFEQTPNSHLSGSGCLKCGINQTATKQRGNTDEFILKAREIHGNTYDYSQVNYVAAIVKVIIICNVHGPFSQVPSSHLSGNGCPKCGTISTSNKQRGNTDEFILKAREIHGNTYDYSQVNYVAAIVKVIIICNVHGPIGQSPSKHLSGQGCSKCGDLRASNQLRTTNDAFIQKAREIHGDLYDYSCVDYVGCDTKVSIICQIHGSFDQTPNNHQRGQGCPKCGFAIISDHRRGTIDEFIQKAYEIHGDKYNYSLVDYINSQTKVSITCQIHGPFAQRPNSHVRGRGCPNCKHKTEGKLLEWLQLEFDPSNVESQVTFNECKKESTNRCYRYDFRVGNSAVELDGPQHFTTIERFKNCPEEALANDTHKAFLITAASNGPNLNLIRIYQPWVAADSNNWQEQLLSAIISLEQFRGQVIYIGGDVYDRHRTAYDEIVAQQPTCPLD